MNPYESDPAKIPATDLYADVPFYGRYLPRPDDFQVDPQYVNSESPGALRYWSSVLSLCTKSVRIYPADEGGRDVFALGSVIIYAIEISRHVLNHIDLPKIYFCGKINGHQVLVQERLAGVSLAVAFPYLSESQRASFKQQARAMLRKLHTIKPSGGQQSRVHVVPDPNILNNGRINTLEKDMLFSVTNIDPDTSLTHNDFTPSNCIVDNDKVVGLVDWEMAGFFGWKLAGEVHRKIRTPQKEHFANVASSEEKLRDIMWWNDLYDEGIPVDPNIQNSLCNK
ncbi:kinase-like domain-containing protein [Xylariaceae sp. FL0255]|nr:kinase-like domain-containing protein [Xylariaceae sp. FL0255]